MPSFLTSGKTAALIGASRGWSFSNTRFVRLAVLVGRLVLVVGLAEERQRGPIGAGRGLDHVRDEPLLGQVVEVGQVLAAAAVARLAVGVDLDDQLVALAHELAFHVAAQVEVAAMGDAFQLAELARRQEREGVFDVGRAARVVAQLLLVVLAQPQPLAGQAQVEIPLVAAVAPVLVPLAATCSGWQKNSISICSNSRERKVKFRGVISLRKLLPIWAMPNGISHPRAVEHVLEVDEDALGRLGTEEGRVFLAAQRADDRS